MMYLVKGETSAAAVAGRAIAEGEAAHAIGRIALADDDSPFLRASERHVPA